MVTHGGITEFEHEKPKISEMSDRVVGLIAGDALRGNQLVRAIAATIPGAAATLQSVSGVAGAVYTEQRRLQIEGEIFAPRGISIQQFYQGLQLQMQQQLAFAIDQQVASFNYGVELLIGCVDDAGGSLIQVVNPGLVSDLSPIGFGAVGSGTIHALQSMIGFGHTGARALSETVFSVYVSKRRAEVAPGVGRDTDLAIVNRDGIAYLDKTMLDQLESIYAEYQRPVSDEIKQRVAALPLLETEVKPDGNKQ